MTPDSSGRTVPLQVPPGFEGCVASQRRSTTFHQWIHRKLNSCRSLESGRKFAVLGEEAGRGMSRVGAGERSDRNQQVKALSGRQFGRAFGVRWAGGWCQASGAPEVWRFRRVAAISISVLEVIQDPADDAGLGDEGNDAHFSAAFFANQRIGFEYTSD